MTRRLRWLTALGTIVVLGWLSGPAHAAPDDQSTQLCAGAARACRLSTETWLREGGSYSVVVTGNPNVRVQVTVYRALVLNNELVGLQPISTGGDVVTNRQGIGHARIGLTGLDGKSSGWALVSLGDINGVDLGNSVGQFVGYGARDPLVLGDGFGEQKPAGASLDLQVTGAIPGTRFLVQYRDDDGIWRDASSGSEDTSLTLPNEASTIGYQLPRGLLSVSHEMRLVNLTETTFSEPWLFVPTADGVTQDRTPLFVPPPVGTGIATPGHTNFPDATVRLIAGLLIGVGFGACFVMLPIAHHRRRLRFNDDA